MTGVVSSRFEAVLCLPVFGRSGTSLKLDCVIDTGFSGALTLSNRIISKLGLQWVSIQDTELADGQIVLCDVYAGAVLWNDRRVDFEVDEADTDPLIGMALMREFEVCIHVRNGGTVRITPLQ